MNVRRGLCWILILATWGPRSFAADPVGPIECEFCGPGRVEIGSASWPAFAPPPNTSNIFSSLILDESEHFVLKVTRGAFVPFYFLIISKAHRVRVADLDATELDDLLRFLTHVERFYREALGTPHVAFEHGPRRAGLRGDACAVGGGGGCVDQLHVHLLPFAGQIETSPDLRLPTRFDEPRTLRGLADLTTDAVRARPYIFYQNPAGEARLYAIRDAVPSQLLRLLIAESLGLHDEFNWREFADRGDFWANAAQSVAGYQTWRREGPIVARQNIRSRGWDQRVSGANASFCSFTLATFRVSAD